MAVWQPTQLNLFQKGCCLKEAWSEPLGGGGLERAILACSHMNSMDTAISRRYEENKQSYLISDLFLIISFPLNLYFNSLLTVSHQSYYVFIGFNDIPSYNSQRKKKGTNDFF